VATASRTGTLRLRPGRSSGGVSTLCAMPTVLVALSREGLHGGDNEGQFARSSPPAGAVASAGGPAIAIIAGRRRPAAG
jgi:hypothetical protein